MRITELHLNAYGPFTDLRLDFPEEGKLVMAYGPNEAGKSSLLRALRAWLYGIPPQSTDNFLHEYARMQVGGRLRLRDGRELAFLRRKGSKRTLLDLDGAPLDEDALTPFLGQVSADAFSRMFGIDNDALIRGGQELLEDEGDVGQALFSAGVSGLRLKQVLQRLDNQAGALFKSGGKNQEIAELLRQYNEHLRQKREETVSGAEMKELDLALETAVRDAAASETALAEIMKEEHHLERLQAALPRMGVRAALLERLAPLRQTPLLSEAFTEQRRDAQQMRVQANQQQNALTPELAQLTERLEELQHAGALTLHEDKINGLHQRLGAHQKAQKDLLSLEADHAALLKEMQQQLNLLRPGCALVELPTLCITEAHIKQVRTLSLRRDAVCDASVRARQLRDEAASRLQEAQEQLAALPNTRNESELQRVLDMALARGDLEQAARAAQQECRVLTEEAEAALSRLPLWSGGLDALERLPLPDFETAARFQASFDEWTADRKSADKRLRELDAERAEMESKLKGLLRQGAIVAETDLHEARVSRDGRWQDIRRAWLDGAPVQESPPAMADDYEGQVRHADTQADILRKNAALIAEHAELSRQRERIQQKVDQAHAQQGELEARRNELEAAWRDAWTNSGITPQSPREMHAWLTQKNQLLDQAQRIRKERMAAENTAAEMQALADLLNACLGALGEPVQAASEPYGMLVERCKTLAAALRSANSERINLEKALGGLERDARKADRALEQACLAQQQWEQEWAVCMTDLGLSAAASIADADAFTERWNNLCQNVAKAENYVERIEGIRRDRKTLEEETAAVLQTVAPDLMGRDVVEAINMLHLRYLQDVGDFTQLQQCRQRRAEVQQSLALAQAAQQEGERMLADLCSEAGVASPEELAPLEQQAQERRRLEAELESEEKALYELAGAAPLQQFIEETAAVDGDALPARIAAAREKREMIQQARDQQNRTIGQLSEKINASQARQGAVWAAEAAQECMARLEEKARQYAQLKLASIVLRTEIRKYQAVHQGPLIARASELFQRLTLGAFAGLSVGYNDKDEPVLLGVRPSASTTPMHGMSEGTRDQLYLSLRLATLEKYFEHGEPMPFIVDDILIRFDDDRARATLEVLTELAQETQVLFFTHHARLFEYAQTPELSGRIRALELKR